MRTVQALAVTLLAPVGLVTTDTVSGPSGAVTVELAPEVAPASAAGPQVSLTPTITPVGADATDLAVLDEALAAFRAHGLELPDVEVHYSDDRADC
ncbi:MAG: hypothetical protein HKN41_09905, partial [Ilumatobacter sp.]|nr:hypothetical protein [Ilumatobacter sp.]